MRSLLGFLARLVVLAVVTSLGERKPTIDVAERVVRALGKKLSVLLAEAEQGTL